MAPHAVPYPQWAKVPNRLPPSAFRGCTPRTLPATEVGTLLGGAIANLHLESGRERHGGSGYDARQGTSSRRRSRVRDGVQYSSHGRPLSVFEPAQSQPRKRMPPHRWRGGIPTPKGIQKLRAGQEPGVLYGLVKDLQSASCAGITRIRYEGYSNPKTGFSAGKPALPRLAGPWWFEYPGRLAPKRVCQFLVSAPRVRRIRRPPKGNAR